METNYLNYCMDDLVGINASANNNNCYGTNFLDPSLSTPWKQYQYDCHTNNYYNHTLSNKVYQDFLTLPFDVIKERINLPEFKRKGPRGGVKETFPEKLYKMLVEVENDGLDYVISWQPHGRSFAIHEPEVFIAEILERFFDHKNLNSFKRQLKLYGFQRQHYRDGNTSNCNEEYHPLFLRGRPDICCLMYRTGIKGGAPSPIRINNAPISTNETTSLQLAKGRYHTNPDFASLPYCPELPAKQEPLHVNKSSTRKNSSSSTTSSFERDPASPLKGRDLIKNKFMDSLEPHPICEEASHHSQTIDRIVQLDLLRLFDGTATLSGNTTRIDLDGLERHEEL